MTNSSNDTGPRAVPRERKSGVINWLRHSLSARFLFKVLPPLMLASLLFLLFSGYLTRQDMRERIDTDVEAYALSISRVVDDLMWNFQTEELVSALATISSNPAMLGAELYGDTGKLFLAYGITPMDNGDELQSVETPIYKSKAYGERVELGRLIVYYDYSYADGLSKDQIIAQLIRLFLLFSIMAICVIYAYQRSVGTPLKRLQTAINATDNTGRWVQVDWESQDEIGEVIRAHNAMLRHISKKERALADSENRYRQLFDNALIGIFLMRPDGTARDANKTVAEILGYPNVESMRHNNVTGHYVNPNDRQTLWRELQKTGTISHFRTQLRKRDGEIIWVELSGRMNTEGLFNGILQDITAQVEAQTALEERDELHRAFFEENKAAMLLYDPQDSTIQFVNPAASQYYGYEAEDMTGMSMNELCTMSEEEVFNELSKAAAERRSYFRQVHTLRDGSKRHVEVFTGPVSLGKRQLHYSIVHDVTEKRILEKKLERMATRDQLTGAYNRHAFFQMARAEIMRARRYGHPMTVLMFDLDHFKRVNDTYGHGTGDEVLRTFALRCRADLRESDLFARLGGEEFAAILVETEVEAGMEIAERIRAIAADKPIPTDVGELTVTASIGVATLEAEDSVASILNRADEGLYKAKASGRNTVVNI